jgi:hypothetical protein
LATDTSSQSDGGTCHWYVSALSLHSRLDQMDNFVTVTPEMTSRKRRTGLQSSSDGAGFKFINVDPSTPKESITSRTLIRANAGRYIWNCRKATSKETHKAKPYVRTPLPSPPRSDASSSTDPEIEEMLRSSEELDEWVAMLSSRRSICFNHSPTTDCRNGLQAPLSMFETQIPEDTVRRAIKYCQRPHWVTNDRD